MFLISRVILLLLQDRMAKLVLTVDTNSKDDKENIKIKRSPFSTTQSKTKDIQQTPKSSTSKQSKSKAAKDVLTPQNKPIKLEDFWNVDNLEDSPQFTQGTPVAPPPLSDSRRKRTPRSATV